MSSIFFSMTCLHASGLSFVGAEKKMLERNSLIKQKKENLEIARENLKIGYSALYPKASVNWNNRKTAKEAWEQGYSLDLEASLFAGGAEYSGLASLKRRVAAAEAELQDLEDTLRMELARILLSGSLASEKISVLERSKKTLTDRISEQRRRLQLGQIRAPDILQSQMESLRLDRSIAELEQSLISVQAELQSFLAEEDTQGKQKFADLTQLSREINATLRPRGDFGLASLKHEKEALEYEIKSKWRAHFPKLGAFVSYGDQNRSSSDWSMGLNAQWIFFSGFELPAELRQARAQMRVYDEKLKQATRQRSIDITLKKTELKTFALKLESVQKSKEMARKAVQIQQSDYRRGIVTELEVLSSIQNYEELQTEELDLLNNIASTKISSLSVGVAL